MWHLGNYFCLIAFLSTRKLLILKKERKGKKRDQHCLQKFVSFGEQWYDACERGGAGGREARVQLEESSCRGGRLGADSCGRKCKNRKAGKSAGLRFPMHSGLCLMGPFSWLLMVLSKDSEKTRVIKVGKEVGHDDVVGGKLGPALQPPLPCILFIFWFWVWLWRRLCTQVIGFGFVEYYRLKILHVLVKGKSSLIDKENRSFLSKPEKLSTSARLSTRKEGWVGRSQYEVRQLSW